jgi:four helix bundle protein
VLIVPNNSQHKHCSNRGMPNDQSFRNLKVWQRSMTLVEEIYRVTSSFPRNEQFGLTSQIRRASVSIASNIGEGKRRKRDTVYRNHLDIALGSQGEVEVQLEIAKRVGFLGELEYQRLQAITEEVGRMLNGLVASLRPSDNG